jgi:hypothetical protein
MILSLVYSSLLFSPLIPTIMNQLNKQQYPPYQTNPFNTLTKNIPYIRKAISINKRFWITLLIASVFIALLQQNKNINLDTHIIIVIFSLLIASTTGWLAHLISHSFDFTNAFNNILKHSQTVKFLCRFKPIELSLRWICYQIDFHHKIHHDTTINKKITNIITEFIQNVITQGLGIALLFKWLGITILNNSIPFNYAAMTMYSFLYATVHNINYVFWPSKCHEEHHINELTNFGIDFLDILFNTKFNIENVERVNHYSNNISILCLLLYLIHQHINPKYSIYTFLFGNP